MSSNLEKAKLHITLAQRQGVGGVPTKCERRTKQHEESATNSKRKSHKKWVTQMEKAINMTIT